MSNNAPPITIEHLTKSFGGDVLAVDDLSLVIEEGQVYGLLGPNGAGKTTTLRTLLGLVHPSSGEACLFGERVHSGSTTLRRVGTLVESPGFVPHLSGLANLELFWRAGGRPLSEADFDAALEIASLGDALRRKYKTYSHGMKQRLGLAQALLGRPDVLVLDEPSSGLDPQQMREMREVVRRIAARGATVLLSSHLLGEVEQVCTHAAVMNKGRLVSAGTVAELMGSTTTVYLEVDDVGRARSVLDALSGVSRITLELPGMSVELNGIERKAIVAALVGAGVGVETVTSRHRLEDAFIELMEAEPA
jgi:ABC-2 type transport system ATP-binding protein